MTVSDTRDGSCYSWRARTCWAALVIASAAIPTAASEPAGAKSPATPSITLAEELSERNPTAFSRRLGEVLGVEVRLPIKGFQKLTVPAGEWTAPRLLNHVARQIDDASWQEVIELRTRINGRAAASLPPPKLPLTGTVTLRAEGWTYPRVVRAVQESAPCVIRLPNGIPPGRFRIAWESAPLERVLAELSAAGGLRVARVIVFQRGEEAQAEAARLQEEQQSREALQQVEIANRLEELYGSDAYSDGFPWDNIDRDALSVTLGREFEMDPVVVDTLLERIRLEGLTRRTE